MPKPLPLRWFSCALLLASMSLLGLAACSDDSANSANSANSGGEGTDTPAPRPEPPIFITSENSLRPFGSCDELEASMEDVVVRTLVQMRYEEQNDDDSFEGKSSATDGAWKANDQKIEMAQLAKADEGFLYMALGTELTILRSRPAEETEKIASVELGALVRGLFVEGDRALVFSLSNNSVPSAIPPRIVSGTRATLLDISDRENPQVLRQIIVEGEMVSASLVDGRVNLAFNSQLSIPEELLGLARDTSLGLPNFAPGSTHAEQDAVRAEASEILRPRVREFLGSLPAEMWLPLHSDVFGSQGESFAPLLACDQVLTPGTSSPPGMLSLLSLDLRAERAELKVTGIQGSGLQVHVSEDKLYAAQSSRSWWWGWGESPEVETHIHQFSLGEAPRYEASGAVSGWMLDEGSLHEENGYLRVVTQGGTFERTSGEATAGSGSPGGSIPASRVNHLFVLEQREQQLGIVGQARGAITGERLTTARMMGGKGYLTTFPATDPLVMLDLSDPFNPRAAGELPVPGNSYLRQLDSDHVLTVGSRDEEDEQGVSLRIFDVSDPANPSLAHELHLSDGFWSAYSDFDRPASLQDGLFSIQLDTQEPSSGPEGSDDVEQISGLSVFSVDAQGGIEALGRVDHRDLLLRRVCPEASRDSAPCDDFYQHEWDAQLRGGLHVGDHLFSISLVGVKVSDLQDPDQTLASVLFPER